MDLDLAKLNYTFQSKPLLIGGKAMEYYGLRPTGNDIDLVVTREDYERLAQQYPDHLKDLWGDLGVCVYEFEIWKSICLYGLDDLSPGAVELDAYRVISREKLLFLKTLDLERDKSRRDVGLIVKKLLEERYAPWWAGLPEERRQYYLAQKKQADQAQ